MRHVPGAVRRVPREAAAELIEHPARGHAVERQDQHLERARLAAQRHAQQELEGHRLGELRRPAEAAPPGVERAAEPLERGVRDLLAERAVGGSELPGVRDRLRHACALDLDLVAPGLPGVGDPLQDLAERRHAVPGLVGEVRAGVERLPVRREEDRHRPAARTGHRLDGVHVDPVDVGALLPVHLHGDEPRVEQGRGLGVFERLALHHVAPVAGRVADRQEHGAVLGSGLREGLVAPRVPVDRVVGVLQQVGALLPDQPVRGGLGHAASLARSEASHTSPQVGPAGAHARGRVRRW